MTQPTYTEIITVDPTEPDDPKPKFEFLPWIAERGVVVVTILLIVAAAVFIDGFASLATITDVFYRAAPIGIVALGMTFVVVSSSQ